MILAWLAVVGLYLCIQMHLFLLSTFSLLVQQLEEAAARAAEEEKKRLRTQMELQDRFSLELEREKMVHV